MKISETSRSTVKRKKKCVCNKITDNPKQFLPSLHKKYKHRARYEQLFCKQDLVNNKKTVCDSKTKQRFKNIQTKTTINWIPLYLKLVQVSISIRNGRLQLNIVRNFIFKAASTDAYTMVIFQTPHLSNRRFLFQGYKPIISLN